jgi:hypothetical protein
VSKLDFVERIERMEFDGIIRTFQTRPKSIFPTLKMFSQSQNPLSRRVPAFVSNPAIKNSLENPLRAASLSLHAHPQSRAQSNNPSIVSKQRASALGGIAGGGLEGGKVLLKDENHMVMKVGELPEEVRAALDASGMSEISSREV